MPKPLAPGPPIPSDSQTREPERSAWRNPAGWQQHRLRLSRAGTTLTICFHPDEPDWLQIAPRYWQGEDLGLATVARSSQAVVQRGTVPPHQAPHYFKRFLLRDWRDVLKHMLKPSRARRDLLHTEQLWTHGFNSLQPVCLIEERRLGRVTGSALITEEVLGAHTVRQWLCLPGLGIAGHPPRKQALLRALATEVARLHQAGFHHGDSRLGNILCRMEANGFRFYFLDNERTGHFDSLPLRLRAHNLLQLNAEPAGASRTDRLRFWKTYVQSAQLAPAVQDVLLRQTIIRTQARWRRRGWL